MKKRRLWWWDFNPNNGYAFYELDDINYNRQKETKKHAKGFPV